MGFELTAPPSVPPPPRRTTRELTPSSSPRSIRISAASCTAGRITREDRRRRRQRLPPSPPRMTRQRACFRAFSRAFLPALGAGAQRPEPGARPWRGGWRRTSSPTANRTRPFLAVKKGGRIFGKRARVSLPSPARSSWITACFAATRTSTLRRA